MKAKQTEVISAAQCKQDSARGQLYILQIVGPRMRTRVRSPRKTGKREAERICLLECQRLIMSKLLGETKCEVVHKHCALITRVKVNSGEKMSKVQDPARLCSKVSVASNQRMLMLYKRLTSVMQAESPVSSLQRPPTHRQQLSLSCP